MMKLDKTRIGPSNYNVKTLQLKIPVFLLYLLNLLSQHESEDVPTRLERLLKRTLLSYIASQSFKCLDAITVMFWSVQICKQACVTIMCRNDELSWLFTNRFKTTRYRA